MPTVTAIASKTVAAYSLASVLFFVLGAGALGALDQPEFECQGGWTLQTCWDKADAFYEKAAETQAKAAKAAKEAEGDEAAQKTTPSNLAVQNRSLIDLLPGFLGAIGITGINETEAGGLAFDKVFTLAGPLRLAIGGEVADPMLFPALDAKLEELDLDDLRDDLSAEQGDFASVDFRAKLSVEGQLGDRRFGRDRTRYGWFTNHYYQEVIASAAAGPGIPSHTWALQAGNQCQGFDVATAITTMTVAQYRAKCGDAAVAALIAAAKGMRAFLGTDVDERLDQIMDLIGNQPQFLIDVTYKDRQDLAGPSSLQGTLRYEMGLRGNVNDFLTWAKHTKDPACASWSATGNGPALPPYTCYQRYAAVAKKGAGERGNRLSLDVSYEKTDAFSYALPDGHEPFSLDETEKWVASLTYGRYLNDFSFVRTQAGADKEDRARLDLEAKYEDVSGDPMRQSRFVASLTLTQAMTDGTDLSVTAVYANKPEYLGEVDHEVSAHFGLKWSGFGKKDKKAGDGS